MVLVLVYELVHLSGFVFGQAVYAVDDYDEGVYIETGTLMAHGYKLFSQIYSAQPPLLPTLLSLTDRLFGTSAAGARATILILGLVTLLGVAGVSWHAGRWVASGFAALFLSLSPEFLVYSHAVEEEIPVMAFATVCLALMLRWRTRQGNAGASVAGLFFGLAILTKFFAFALLAPLLIVVALALWDARHPQGSPRPLPVRRLVSSVLFFLCGSVVPIAVSFLAFGADEWKQMVSDRITASTQAAGSITSNIHQILVFAATDRGLTVLAVGGGLLLLRTDWRLGLILDGWASATVAMLARYHPLMGHHPVILLAPAACLGGIAVSRLWPDSYLSNARMTEGPRPSPTPGTAEQFNRTAVVRMAAACSLLVYILFFPALATSYGALLVRDQSPYAAALTKAGSLVRRSALPGDLVAAGNAWVCVDARRLCVPDMVDTSYVRVTSGSLTARAAILDTERARAAVVVLDRGLCPQQGYLAMRPYVQWVHIHYRRREGVPGLQGGCGAVYAR